MISGIAQKYSRFAPNQVLTQAKSSKSGVRGEIERRLIPLAIGFTTVGMMIAMDQSAVAQSSAQYSGCIAEAQGLMCHPGNRVLENNAAPVSAPRVTSTTLLQPLSNAQMERIADTLLGLLYFVLPVGFGIGLFLHDRHQAQRTATLEAQIKLLEKIWEQNPQA